MGLRSGKKRSGTGEVAELAPVFADVRRSTQPLIWVGTVVEVITAGAAVASLVPDWAVSGLLVGIPAVTFAIVQRRRASSAIGQVRQLYNYDRKYTEYFVRWTLGPSEDPRYWSGINYTHRKFVALKPMRTWEWSVSRRSDDDVPFSNVSLRNRSVTRTQDGTAVFREPHLTTSRFKFAIEFDPPLRVGEWATLSFEALVPTHKVASLELLRNRLKPSLPAPADCDFSSVSLSFPIDDFQYELVIPESLGSRRHGLQVVERQNEYIHEKNLIDAEKMFTVARSTGDGNAPAWKMSLRRKLPPVGTTYRIVWEPPNLPNRSGDPKSSAQVAPVQHDGAAKPAADS